MADYFCIKDFEKDIKSFKDMYDKFKKNKEYLLIEKDKEQNINKDDFIYVAVRKLPDESNRLFFKCKVKKIDNNNIYVWCIKAISNTFFDEFKLDELKTKYKDDTLYDKFPNEWKNGKKKFDKELNNPNEYFTIRNLKDYYYIFKCESCGKTKTFINANYVQGAEFHHFIPRHTNSEKKSFINEDDNYTMLCPNCHSMIHNAEFESRKKAIKDIFYNKKKNSDYYEEMKKYINKQAKKIDVNNDEELIDWIFKQYLNDREKKILGIKN